MAKFFIILLAIVVGFILAVNYALGALRRMLGIPPRKGGFQSWAKWFGHQKERSRQEAASADKVLYEKDDVVVLSGDSQQSVETGFDKIRDARFSEKKKNS